MSFFELQKKDFLLKTEQDANIKHAFILNQFTVVLYYKVKFIVMDIQKDKILFMSPNFYPLGFFAKASQTSFAYITYLQRRHALEMFDLSTGKRTKYQTSYYIHSCKSIFWIQATKSLYLSSGYCKTSQLQLCQQKLSTPQKFFAIMHQKYGESSISGFNQRKQLVILTGNKVKTTYALPYQEIKHFHAVKQHSDTEAMIAFKAQIRQFNGYDGDIVIIFSLVKRQVIKECRLRTQSSSIKQLNGDYVSIYKSFATTKFMIGFQECFSDKEQINFKHQQLVEQSTDKTFYFKDPDSVQLVVHYVNNNKFILTKVELVKANKIYRYIHLLEELGWIMEFESDIVNAVINNLY